jgi:hypothetical protein
MFISSVNDTGEKRENFEIKFFFLFCWELSLVHFTPQDWIFAYFKFLGVGKLTVYRQNSLIAGVFDTAE